MALGLGALLTASTRAFNILMAVGGWRLSAVAWH